MLERITIQELNKNHDDYKDLGGTIKIVLSDNDEEIRKIAEEYMPRELNPTHYLVTKIIPIALGVCDVSISYLKRKEPLRY